jgi:4-hydroxybenzoate polyprenyltransferase
VGAAKDWALIIRPPIVVISVAGASVGFLNATIGEPHPLVFNYAFPWVGWIVNAVAAALMASGLMVHNDYYDLESDKVNRPHKVLAQGRVKAKTARDVGFALMVAGVALSFLGHPQATLIDSINWVAGLIALTVLADGLLYNTIGKKHGIGGHIEVAYGVALIPVFGAAGAHNVMLVLPLGLGLFVMEIGREIMVAGGDIEGDRKAGWVTLPVKIGMKPALAVALACYLISLPLFLLPVLAPAWVPWRPSLLYVAGSTAFIAGLIALWVPCWKDPKFEVFEKYIRTGSRLLVFGFELLLIAEAFV